MCCEQLDRVCKIARLAATAVSRRKGLWKDVEIVWICEKEKQMFWHMLWSDCWSLQEYGVERLSVRDTSVLQQACVTKSKIDGTFVCLRLAHQSEASSAATNADGSFRLCFGYCYCCWLPQRYGKTCFVVGRVSGLWHFESLQRPLLWMMEDVDNVTLDWRPIKPFSSRFPLKFPSGSMELNSFIR